MKPKEDKLLGLVCVSKKDAYDARAAGQLLEQMLMQRDHALSSQTDQNNQDSDIANRHAFQFYRYLLIRVMRGVGSGTC